MTIMEAIRQAGRTVHDIGPDAARSPREHTEERDEQTVTVDLDDATPLDLYRAWSVLVRADCYDVEARVSSGGEGFHVRGWLPGDVPAEAVERLRYQAGDHPRRTYMDRTHALKPTNITFSRKADREAGEWRRSPWLAADDLRARSERFGPPGWSR